jgi:hypothetical protein
MSFVQKTLPLFVFLAVPFLALGCGGNKAGRDPEVEHRKNELGEIYEIYTQFAKRSGRPPKKFSDVNQKDLQASNPVGFKALQDNKYIVVWGVTSNDSGAVMAYEKDADKQGGWVLIADGTPKQMTAEELHQALPKANK